MGSTVIVLTGEGLHFVEQAAALARRLQPSIVVLEDVDLVARDRGFAPGGNPVLFALLDAMDGVGADADVAFVLTTNRAAILERALADRPGRVDLAVEIPVPDEAGRARLLALYAGTLGLPPDISEIVAATEGVTASYVKELLRRAVLAAMRDGEVPAALTLEHFAAALAEMSAEHESLTRSLLGDGSAADEASAAGLEPGPPMPAGIARAFIRGRGGGFYRGHLR